MPDLHIRLLGGVGAATGDGEPIDLGPAKCKAVLAALALSPGEAVPVPRLVELVWGDEPPRTAEKTLQSYVTRLRKALGADLITRTGAAYRLEIDPLAVDVGRFQRHLDDGDIGAAIEAWGGTPLAGLEDVGLVPAADALTERWLAALELDAERQAATDPNAAIVALTELTATHPYREGLWALLMIALYRVGRQADALGAYRRARAVLVEELGVEPGQRLQELEALILGQDEQLDEPATGAQAAGTGRQPEADTTRHNLPLQSTELFGREEHIAEVTGLLDDRRLVTLIGMGGAGKTRLALAAAAELITGCADGVFFVPLAAIDDPADVSAAIGAAVGMTMGSNDARSVAAFVASRQMLIVLDNCEHVIDGAAEMADLVLSAGTSGRMLATSREVLDVEAEQVYPVPPIDGATIDSPGVDLLIDRGCRVRPDLDTGPSARAAMAEVVARLDGIPLALELAAGQFAHLSPSEVGERIDERFQLFVSGRRGRGARQRTLRATMDWSWDLLDADERIVLGQLSVFAGGWTLDAAEGVCRPGEHGPVSEVLRSLVTKSLVVAETADGRTRYRMLETVRLYGQQRLDEAGDADDGRDRHARYFCGAADAVPFSDRYTLPDLAVQWSQETGNIIAAIDFLRSVGRLVEGARLVTMPALTWRFHPAPRSLLTAIGELIDADLDDRLRCTLLLASAEAGLGRRGMTVRAERARHVVELARSIDDDAVASGALLAIGTSYGAVQPDLAEELLLEAAERAAAIGDDRQEASALGMLVGVEAFGRRDYGKARAVLGRAAAKATPDGIENHIIASQESALEVLEGNWEAAEAAHRRLLALHAAHGYPLSWSNAIDDAVLSGRLGRKIERPLAAAVAELEAAGGVPDRPDLLVIPLERACREADWDLATRIVAAIRSAGRSGQRIATPHAVAYYTGCRREIPPGATDRFGSESVDAGPAVAELIAELVAQEARAEG